MSGRVVFLVNPASAGGSTGRRWPEIARRAASQGLVGDALLSEAPGHLRALAREATRSGATRLVVVGGDGSVHEVVNGIADADAVELALIPRGTGWDFARTFGIPRNLDRAIAVAREGEVRRVDLGLARFRAWAGVEESARFANVASAGISGAIAKRANESSKVLGGRVSYYWATLAVFFGWRIGEMQVTVDGETRSGRMIDVMVCNGRYLGGGMMMCPEAEPDDGRFDVLTIGDVTRRDLAFVLPKVYRGRHLPHPRLELLRGATVEVEAEEPLPLELDGEQPGTTPARFEVLPRALALRAPRPTS
ncbi:MAG: diacylglycerol kinase family lipid kinase [Thermoleophilia bacterium]|nr:diacylglycerol kinase family lipid kinase [Thermoleophilia bacterium]